MDEQVLNARMAENERIGPVGKQPITGEESKQEKEPEDWWLIASREAFLQSTTFMDNNLRKKWEDNYRHFQSRHHSGSKYHKAAYKYRTKLFRPKTRSVIRQHEAAANAAFFSNRDVVNIEPQNDADDFQRASAEINTELLQYRLTKTIPWFMICIGAFQEAMVPGAVISYQYWDYQEIEEEDIYELWDGDTGKPIIDALTGETATESEKRTTVLKDQPCIELRPLENIRIHPNSLWTDPINSSPYLIDKIPMYVMDVKARMKTGSSKTNQKKWNTLTDEQISSGKMNTYDSTRQTRDQERTDRTENTHVPTLSDFDVVWVHRNFIRKDGIDHVFYTLGTEHMLSDPVRASEVYFKKERPYAYGITVIEAHRMFPSGLGELGKQVQIEINDNVNQRQDNVKFALNKRWFVKRGQQVDIKSITRNVPGSVTMVNDPSSDVKEGEFHDVTRSAYEEQDRLNADFDELVGNFSLSTINTNRKLNETVGGMSMARGTVNALSEYSLRTFGETWMETVIRQMVMLEQMYETDEVILVIAAQKAKLYQKYGINQITDSLLNQELTTAINVGMGATDPIMKLRNFSIGLETIINVITQMQGAGPLDVFAIAEEVLALLGYKDGARFLRDQFGGQDPEKMEMAAIIQQMQAVIDDLQKQIDMKTIDAKTKLALAEIKEMNQNRRTAAQEKTKLAMKRMDLLNPVVGERPRQNA